MYRDPVAFDVEAHASSVLLSRLKTDMCEHWTTGAETFVRTAGGGTQCVVDNGQ